MRLFIIGGGAAGLCAAITAKRRSPLLDVTVLEANDRVGKKLITTGNGRCNITNRRLKTESYHGGTELCSVLDNDFICRFFSSVGTEIVFEEDGKAYPASFQALSVVDNLRFACDELGVNIITGSRVSDISFLNGVFKITADKTYSADAVIIATGSAAGGKIASDGGYTLLKQFGHRIVPAFPAIAQIKTETDIVRQLKGIKINAEATVFVNSKPVRSEYGEVLFCDYGLSGPPVLQLSRVVSQFPGKTEITLDLMPDFKQNEVEDLLTERKKLLYNRVAGEFFTGLINKRLGQVLCKLSGVSINDSTADLDTKKLAALIKSLKFKAVGVNPSSAQVMAGGADTSEFSDCFMSKKQKGLFAAGEVLDVDGDCGGFNLAFAWCSGAAAANAAVDYLK